MSKGLLDMNFHHRKDHPDLDIRNILYYIVTEARKKHADHERVKYSSQNSSRPPEYPLTQPASPPSRKTATRRATNFLNLHLHFIAPLFALVLPAICKYDRALTNSTLLER